MKLHVMTAVALLSLGGVAWLPPAGYGAEQVSREVGLPMKEAQTAIGRKQWDAALASIHKAQAITGKSALEEYQINEMLAYVYNEKQDFAAAARAYEANLASGRVPPDQLPARLAAVTRMHAGLGNAAKAIEFGNRWIKASPGDPAAHHEVAQALFRQKSYAAASRSISHAIALVEKSGRKPDESWLQLQLSFLRELKDEAALAEAQQDLVRHFPNRENWKAVLVTLEKHFKTLTSDEARDLNVLRLRQELDLLEKPAHYQDLAQLAISQGTPHEAIRVVEKGMTSKALEGRDRARYARLLATAKELAQQADVEIVALDKAARAASTGEQDVELGNRYLAAGNYAKAVEAIQRGLKKGRVRSADEAQLLLGRAYLKLNDKDKARKAFGAIAEEPKLVQVAQLWSMHAGQL